MRAVPAAYKKGVPEGTPLRISFFAVLLALLDFSLGCSKPCDRHPER